MQLSVFGSGPSSAPRVEVDRDELTSLNQRSSGACLSVSPVRRRSLPFGGWTGRNTTTFSFGEEPRTSTVYGGFNAAKPWQGTQYTESENHPSWLSRKPGQFRGDVGGNFFTMRKYVTPAKAAVIHLSGIQSDGPPASRFHTTNYVGPFLAIGPPQGGFPVSLSSGNTALEAWGTKAVALCKPTNRIASAATAALEIYRDGLPKMFGHAFWKDKTVTARGAGSEYLNYEFGWLPTANDIASFAAGVFDLDRMLKQYERDSGKVVRRRFSFPPIRTAESSVYIGNTSPMTDPFSTTLINSSLYNKGQIVKYRITEIRRWFTGAFTYYLPDGYNHRKEMAKHASLAGRLLGVELTPEVVWNIAPWSWAVDWFTNAGDVISNLSDWSTDGLVLKYGYIMEHTKCSETYSFTGPTGYQSSGVRPQAITFVTETKARRKATPFGFGLTLSSLTDRQKAIMTALGLSRSKRR